MAKLFWTRKGTLQKFNSIFTSLSKNFCHLQGFFQMLDGWSLIEDVTMRLKYLLYLPYASSLRRTVAWPTRLLNLFLNVLLDNRLLLREILSLKNFVDMGFKFDQIVSAKISKNSFKNSKKIINLHESLFHRQLFLLQGQKSIKIAKYLPKMLLPALPVL